jgi:hypothetical protein
MFKVYYFFGTWTFHPLEVKLFAYAIPAVDGAVFPVKSKDPSLVS